MLMKDSGTSLNGNNTIVENRIKFSGIDLQIANTLLRDLEPMQIIEWVMEHAQKPIITTNFGPYSASLLHAVTSVKKDINVIWCDTGYNTPHTYRYAKNIMDKLSLNMHIYTPKLTPGFRDVTMGIPSLDSEEHKTFTHEVKLEPFSRALKEHQPDVWFSNLRKEQTQFRSGLDILHVNRDGILKVSPFFYYTERELEIYLNRFDLPNEKKYFDPTKVLEKRECGLHL